MNGKQGVKFEYILIVNSGGAVKMPHLVSASSTMAQDLGSRYNENRSEENHNEIKMFEHGKCFVGLLLIFSHTMPGTYWSQPSPLFSAVHASRTPRTSFKQNHEVPQ